MADLDIKPVTLTGKYVRLEPLTLEHTEALAQIGVGCDFWDFMVYGKMESVEDMHNWVKSILARAERGTDLPFVAIHLASGRVAGATRYLNIMTHDRWLEVGGTWYGLEFQRTALNTECKYLLLQHAFETLGAVRVQLKTDSRNIRSQHAIERIGAQKEGVLRNHMILPNGYIRDSVFYSILDSEWLDAKKRLEEMMAKHVDK
ncbi:MAG: GNAT family N-acetyltransferase [Anaerolineales bacterium]|nr:GNAT family N-acetyltransferase [Anaerolineales bacterium]